MKPISLARPWSDSGSQARCWLTARTREGPGQLQLRMNSGKIRSKWLNGSISNKWAVMGVMGLIMKRRTAQQAANLGFHDFFPANKYSETHEYCLWIVEELNFRMPKWSSWPRLTQVDPGWPMLTARSRPKWRSSRRSWSCSCQGPVKRFVELLGCRLGCRLGCAYGVHIGCRLGCLLGGIDGYWKWLWRVTAWSLELHSHIAAQQSSSPFPC